MNEDDVMHRPSERVHSRAAKPRLHLIYFALAAFDLMAVLLGLFLIDRLSALHMESIHVTEVWGHRLDDYVDLMRMAAAVNAPGNDIFNSRDLEAESKHLATSHAAFDLRKRRCRRRLARPTSPPPVPSRRLRSEDEQRRALKGASGPETAARPSAAIDINGVQLLWRLEASIEPLAAEPIQ